ncbi:hypothetical protein VTK26DRAFT_2954 [Humicola hyalothermophila]
MSSRSLVYLVALLACLSLYLSLSLSLSLVRVFPSRWPSVSQPRLRISSISSSSSLQQLPTDLPNRHSLERPSAFSSLLDFVVCRR